MVRRPTLRRHQILLPEGMWDELEQFYPEHPRVAVIRALIGDHIRKLRASRVVAVDVDLEEKETSSE